MQVEIYFIEDDEYGPFSPRNEVEALNSVLSALQIVENVKKSDNMIDILITIVLNKLASMTIPQNSFKPGVVCEGEAERLLLTWAKNEGVKSKIDVAGQFSVIGLTTSF